MGAMTSLLLLKKAKQIVFGFAEVPEDIGARRVTLAAVNSDSLQHRLDDLDKQFRADPDKLAERQEAFAIHHGLVQLTAR